MLTIIMLECTLIILLDIVFTSLNTDKRLIHALYGQVLLVLVMMCAFDAENYVYYIPFLLVISAYTGSEIVEYFENKQNN